MGRNYVDKIDNGVFKRNRDGQQVELETTEAQKISETFNSVIYFATLPSKLDDPAANASLLEEVTIKGKTYDVIKIVFSQDGGGVDFEDEYRYWINKETKEIDYLGYVYWVDGGGVRLKAAFNKRRINGILFQDYEFYEAELGTDLDSLPSLYEKVELNLLSRIVLEDVRNLSK